MTSLGPDQRYSRQILFQGIGAEGQLRLANARVAMVGCGATGSAPASGAGELPVILLLAKTVFRASGFHHTDHGADPAFAGEVMTDA